MVQHASYVMNYVHDALEAQALNVLLVEMEPFSTVLSASHAIKHVKHAQGT